MKFFEIDILFHALQITALVFIMMVIIDWIDVRTRGKLPKWISRHPVFQYLIAGFLGLTPGCMGAYMNVSLYMHGYLSAGAMVGGMIATSGEASLVMFSEFPRVAFILHGLMFSFAVIFAAITDLILKYIKILPRHECQDLVYHKDETSLLHYVREHIWRHILRKHIWRIFLWTFFAIWIVHLGSEYLHIDQFVKANPQLVLLIAVLIGIIPDVAPQFIFVFMFSQGLIPFSVLLTSSMVQNGHGLLPLLSYSVKDSVIIKTFNIIFGLITGLIVMALGY